MPYNVSIAGVTFPLPSQSERNWAAQVNAFFVALGQSLLQKSGGSFTLTNEVDFGANFGAYFAYIKSKTAGSGAIASAGWVRLTKIDRIAWRNILDTADIPLGLSQSSGRLQTGVATYFSANDGTDVFNVSLDATLRGAGRLPVVGEKVQVQSFTGTGITLGTNYWAADVDTATNTFKLYTTEGGPTYLDVTGAGTGYMVIQDDIATSSSIDNMRNKKMVDLAYDSEVGTISGNSINTTSGKTVQRITASDSELWQINHPADGKVYCFVNESGADVTIKHNAGTSPRGIFTPGGVDFTWKENAAVTFIYNSTLAAWIIAGGSGGGDESEDDSVNLIRNPSDAEAGWTTAGTNFLAPITTFLSGDLPLEGVIDKAIQIRVVGSGAEASEHTNYPFTTSAAMKGKLQVTLFMLPGTGFAANEWTISVYQGSTRQTLRWDSSGVSYLPNGVTRYTTSFDALASTAYTLRFARISGSGAATLNAAKVFLGWPFVSETAASGEYAQVSTFTIGAVTTPPTPGTGSTFLRNTFRGGRWANVRYEFRQTIAGSAGSGNYLFPIDSGLAIDYTRAGVLASSSGVGHVGDGTLEINGAYFKLSAYVANSGVYINQIYFFYSNDTTAPTLWGSGGGALNNAAVSLSINVRVPIQGWGDSVLLGPGSDPELISTGGTWDANSSTTVQGGSAIGGTLTGDRVKTVTWTYPLQSIDDIEIVYSSDNVSWVPINGAMIGSTRVVPAIDSTGTSFAGVFWKHISSTQTEINFSRWPNFANDDSPTVNWPASGYWGVRRRRGGQLAFEAATASRSGLLSAYDQGTWTPAEVSKTNITGTAVFGVATYTRIGNTVFARLYDITGLTVTNTATETIYQFSSTGLPGIINATRCIGTARTTTAGGNRTVCANITDSSGSDTNLYLSFASNGTGVLTLVDFLIQYTI